MHLGIVMAFAAASAGPVGTQTVQPSAGGVSSAPTKEPVPINDHKTDQNATQERAPEIKPGPSPAADAVPPVKSVITPLATDDTERDRAEEQQRAEKDLKAQESMACAAWLMFIVTSLSFVASCFGIYLLYGTLRYTRHAAKAGRDAVKAARASVAEAKNSVVYAKESVAEAQKSTAYARESVEEARKATGVANDTLEVTRFHGERQLRAYLFVTGTQITTDENAFNGGYVAFVVRYKNAGQTPAEEIVISAGIGFDHSQPTRPKHKGNIEPGGEYFSLFETRGISGGQFKDLLVFGCVTYRDCFGNARETNFRSRHVPGNEGHLVTMEADEGNTAT